MRTITLKSGATVPALGLGTWHMGERSNAKAAEVRALKAGIDLGMTLIDTAEMYGEGGAEEVVGEAIAGRRDELFLVSKVYPHNASKSGAIAACERSLKRMKVEKIDLYLLHWRGSYALTETVEAFETLKAAGKIGSWGVSNFDHDDMAELAQVKHGAECVTNQVLYHLGERGIEYDLLPECRRSNVMVMAYSPLGQADILGNATLASLAKKHAVTPAAIALAAILREPSVVAIPKASHLDHVAANAKAMSVKLDADDLKAIDTAFPPPRRKSPLAML
ncbi:MAG: aldo/keto reductase [Hyphomicrobiaceae bacterium]|nr:aldo/keto reductase [Hyphomicrobiaceae bacterium]